MDLFRKISKSFLPYLALFVLVARAIFQRLEVGWISTETVCTSEIGRTVTVAHTFLGFSKTMEKFKLESYTTAPMPPLL